MSLFVRCFTLLLFFAVATVCHGQPLVSGSLSVVGKPDEEVSLLQIPSISRWTRSSGPIDVTQVVRFGNPHLIHEDGVIAMEDGSRIVAKELRSEGTTLHGYNRLWDEIQVPLRPIRGIVLRAHLVPDETQQSLDQIQAYEGSKDRLLLTNGDHIDGTFRRLTPLKVEFQLGEKSLKLDRKQVKEIYFAKTVGGLPPAGKGVWVGLRDGSLILAQEALLQEERLMVQTGGGLTLRSSSLENAYDFVTYLRPIETNVRYLSDQNAIGFKSLGFLSATWDYAKDRNVRGGTLKSGGYISQKGIGLHATSRIAYKVGPEDKHFRAKVGIDDDTHGAGSVIFKVFVSETGKAWKTVFESPIVRGGEKPLDVDVPVQGMKGIALVVEFADGADVLDHANWMDARFE